MPYFSRTILSYLIKQAHLDNLYTRNLKLSIPINQASIISSSPIEPELFPVTLNSCTLNEGPCFEHLLGLKFNPEFNWNSYFFFAKDAAKMDGPLSQPKLYLTTSELYFYKSLIRLKVK